MPRSRYTVIILCALLFALGHPVAGQLGFDLDIKKPEPYENRELKAEKTGDKKLKAPRRFMQNLTTHYNYFFNANTKLNEIIARAKAAQKDDYTALLPFYNYALNTTAADSALLDSVIAKSKTALVLHDLRNDWVDNMYMLWGASYYFQKDFDSAYQMFQFINYSFAEKEADGYYRYIGSRMDGNNAASIATEENRNLAKRVLSEPPSRNDAFIWQVRTMIQQDAITEAGSLIKTLKNDPAFPKRLEGALHEVQALWFYRQGIWDSAAFHLVDALGEAKTKGERARWEYLAGQLFELKGFASEAKTYYTKAITHTIDPVMDIHARLNMIRINKEGGDNYINDNISELLKMARRDKYAEYRDVIYSMAAQMELERGNFVAAQLLLFQASKYKSDNVAASNRAYLQLADLSFARRDYGQAVAFYDSIKVTELAPAESERVAGRKEILSRLTVHNAIISRQDSMQRIAALPEEERTALLKRLVRQLRRAQGLKEEETITGGRGTTTVPDPFAETGPKTGEWYFYNKNLRTTGAASFRQTWGNRPNIDNWRRFTDVSAQLRQNTLQGDRRGLRPIPAEAIPQPISFEALFSRLPFTPALIDASNDSIRYALQTLGGMYVDELEDYTSAITTFEELQRRFPLEDLSPEALFQLAYSYTKTGQAAKADEVKKLLLQKYPQDRRSIILTTGKDPLSPKPSEAVTKTYEGIYDLFLEGKFSEAKRGKEVADSMYRTNYWSPQLLYIEAVYHIRQREDSVAQGILSTLIRQNSGSPVAARAQNLLEVLSRRKQIEEELTQLNIQRPPEDTLYVEPMPVAPTVQKRTDVTSVPIDTTARKVVAAKPITDTTFRKPVPQKANALFTFKPDAPTYAVVVLNKVDPVFVNEARNAFNRYNKEKFYNTPLEVSQAAVNDDIKFLLVGEFTNAQGAIEYVQKTKPLTAAQIVPWLKGDKFTFSIITKENLDAVVNLKDYAAYEKFLEQNLPVKF